MQGMHWEALYKDDSCAQHLKAPLTQRQAPTRNATVNMLFKSVLAAAALASTAFAAPSEEKRQSKLKWFGINESGAEFGEKNFTGVYGREYIWYDFSTIDQFIAEGMNMFRLNFRK